MLTRLGIVFLVLPLIACQAQHNKENKVKNNDDFLKERVIYGEDDRKNLYEVKEQFWKTQAASTVALIRKYDLTEKDDHYTIAGGKIGEERNFCADEPFYHEPSSAFCSGSLIGKDIIATAGHCMRNNFDCENTRFVFNFAYKSGPNDDPQTVGKDDVYACSKIIHTEVIGFQGSDFALIRLDREVVGHTPLSVREQGIVGDNDELTVIGHPSGLPTKYADGASVRSNLDADYFIANLDTYGGNSGSAVFNKETGIIEGILVRGETDYVHVNGCVRSNKCPDSGCRGEDVTRITKIFDHISPEELGIIQPSEPIADEPVPPAPVEREDSESHCQRTLGALSPICSLL